MSIYVDIRKKFRDFSLNVAFETDEKFQGILGASGCGKSMTLKAVAGIMTPDKGRIVVDGRTIFDSEKRINLRPQQRNIGFLFQNYALFPNMSVEKNIACGLRGKDNKKVAGLIDTFRLKGLEKRRPSQLSGGQQQRVALARSLAGNPDILMLDEPFSALDEHLKEKLQIQVKDMLEEFRGQVLFVTHSRDEIYRFCNNIMILHNGRKVAEGETGQVFREPVHVMAARISGCKNISRAEKVSDFVIKALDWGIELTADRRIGSRVTHVGIRAHDFRLKECEDKINIIDCTVNRWQENLFEDNIILSPGKGSLWWKTGKNVWEKKTGKADKISLCISPENLMLLEGGKDETD